MKKPNFRLVVLLFFLAGCVQHDKLSEPIVETIESELFMLKVEIPFALIEKGNTLKVSGTVTYFGNKPIE